MPSNGPNDPQPDEIPEDQRIGGEPSPSSRRQSQTPPAPAPVHHEDRAMRSTLDCCCRQTAAQASQAVAHGSIG
jgi:hypothetical protein